MEKRIEWKLYTDLSEREKRKIVELKTLVWPPTDKSVEDVWRIFPHLHVDPNTKHTDRRFLLVWNGKDLIGHAEVFPRTLNTDKGPEVVIALAGLCVHPDFQGNGLGKEISNEVFRFSNEDAECVCLFQTEIPEFYEKLGSRKIDNKFTNSMEIYDKKYCNFWDPNVMIHPGDADWTNGEIDLNGVSY